MGEVKNLTVMATPMGIKECNKCGDCCKHIVLHTGTPLSEETWEWLYARGCGMVRDAILIPLRCPHLKDNNECDIYEKRPEVCKKYQCWT